MAERLRRQTWNLFPYGSAGSNPANCEVGLKNFIPSKPRSAIQSSPQPCSTSTKPNKNILYENCVPVDPRWRNAPWISFRFQEEKQGDHGNLYTPVMRDCILNFFLCFFFLLKKWFNSWRFDCYIHGRFYSSIISLGFFSSTQMNQKGKKVEFIRNSRKKSWLKCKCWFEKKKIQFRFKLTIDGNK